MEGLLSAAAMSRLVGTSESAVKDEIRDDVRRLLQASTLSRREGQAPRTQESIAEEVLGLETMRICARLKAEARERCKLVQAEYRALVSAYCSPRPLAWPAVERPRLECAFVEFRSLPHVRALVANAILRLRCDVCLVCGAMNVDFAEALCATIDYPIRVVKLDEANVDRDRYNALLASEAFWRRLRGDYVLIHQEDALVFDASRVDAILAACDASEVRYLGAPWGGPQVLDCVVGNGGFSLRHRETMVAITRRRAIADFPRGVFPFQDPDEQKPRRFLPSFLSYVAGPNLFVGCTRRTSTSRTGSAKRTTAPALARSSSGSRSSSRRSPSTTAATPPSAATSSGSATRTAGGPAPTGRSRRRSARPTPLVPSGGPSPSRSRQVTSEYKLKQVGPEGAAARDARPVRRRHGERSAAARLAARRQEAGGRGEALLQAAEEAGDARLDGPLRGARREDEGPRVDGEGPVARFRGRGPLRGLEAPRAALLELALELLKREVCVAEAPFEEERRARDTGIGAEAELDVAARRPALGPSLGRRHQVGDAEGRQRHAVLPRVQLLL